MALAGQQVQQSIPSSRRIAAACITFSPTRTVSAGRATFAPPPQREPGVWVGMIVHEGVGGGGSDAGWRGGRGTGGSISMLTVSVHVRNGD